MRLTVKECLELDAFIPSVVLAGKRNIDNLVRSVSVMDAHDPATAVKHNGVRDQLVMTSFCGIEDDFSLQVSIVRELANAGIAALGIFDRNHEAGRKNSALHELADAIGLPLILFPDSNGTEYADVIEQVMGKIFLGDDTVSKLINNTITHLLDFEKHESFPAALREAALSNDFQVVLISKDFNPVLVVETRHRAAVSDAVNILRKNEETEAGSGIYSLIDVNGVTSYWGVIDIDGEKYFLFIVDNDDLYSAMEITKLAEIIELAMGMWKFSPERDVKAELIKALIRGNKSRAYSLKDEMEESDFRIQSVFYAKGINTNKALSIMEKFEAEKDMKIFSIEEENESHGIIIKRGTDEETGEEKTECIDLFNELKELDKSIRIFHVTGLDGIEGAGDGFRLINETWTFVESVFPYKRVFSKYELVLVSNCINIQVQGGYIKKNYVKLLEPFDKEMGENKAKQLLETLETFVLDAGMNSSQTAEFIGVHANTVQYRIKRINEVLGTEITANRVIPGLTIALALRRLERVVN
jgi:hypothetical protein